MMTLDDRIYNFLKQKDSQYLTLIRYEIEDYRDGAIRIDELRERILRFTEDYITQTLLFEGMGTALLNMKEEEDEHI